EIVLKTRFKPLDTLKERNQPNLTRDTMKQAYEYRPVLRLLVKRYNIRKSFRNSTHASRGALYNTPLFRNSFCLMVILGESAGLGRNPGLGGRAKIAVSWIIHEGFLG